jgi:hypothetical protein
MQTAWKSCVVLIAMLTRRCSCYAVFKSYAYTYGKYFSLQSNGSRDLSDNVYYIYKPAPSMAKTPVIFQVFGSGWVHLNIEKPFAVPNPAIARYNAAGIAFVSTAYRLLDRKYWYDAGAGNIKREELIHIGADGLMTLDTTGKTMADYKARTCFLELIAKSTFDVVKSLEHLIDHADEHRLDIHRITFLASSGGSAGVNYLTWVYHQWHKERFTPVGMVLMSPQFNLPVLCTLDLVWKDFLDHMEPQTPITQIGNFKTCLPMIGCNRSTFSALGPEADSVCNPSWNQATISRYCSSAAAFNSATLSSLNQTQKWDASIPEYVSDWRKCGSLRGICCSISQGHFIFSHMRYFHLISSTTLCTCNNMQSMLIKLISITQFIFRNIPA